MLPAMLQEPAASRIVGCLVERTTACTPLAPLVVGDPDHPGVADLGMGQQDGFDLGRIDVDAAR